MGEMENGRRRWRRMGEGRFMGGEKVTSIKMAAAVLLFAVAVVAGKLTLGVGLWLFIMIDADCDDVKTDWI